jgi:hypothetical protein
MLGPWEQFHQRFAAPIERDGDLTRRDLLIQRLRPFLLRRTKSEVAPELPPRTEVLEPVELSDDERKLYDAIRMDILESLATRAKEAEGRKRMAVLAGITRLRRLACHPRLIDSDSLLPSSKLTAALDLIEGFLQRGERALIFSQFTSHLALLREALDFRQVTYLYLDGRTPTTRRAKLVEQWAEGSPALFLISLKAGGTGLNLMGADFVVHLDPWWNPAVEDQAADRTHRIGQTRPVTVVRLIAQGTIEEAVLDLHARKRELARGLLEGADAAGHLSSNDLLALIRWGDEGLDPEGPPPIPQQPPPEGEGLAPDDLTEIAPDPLIEQGGEGTSGSSSAPPEVPPLDPQQPPPEVGELAPDGRLTELSCKALQELGERFSSDLDVQRRMELIKTDATVALYRRVLKRFLSYAQERAEAGGRSLDLWSQEYLQALNDGTFPAPVSEPTIARTVLVRLQRFADSD